MRAAVNCAEGACYENEKASGEHPQFDVETHQLAKPFPQLTQRERVIATMLALGERNRDVAKELGISAKTVDTHRSHILKKLGCRNNVDLAHLAIREGYVSVKPEIKS